MDRINESLARGDVREALAQLSELELQIEDSSISQNACTVDPHFYATFLACYLIENELSNAKYLWKRAPEVYKVVGTGAQLVEFWEVGKAIWKEELSRAIELINNTSWIADLRHLADMLKSRLITSHLLSIGLAYDHIQLSVLTQTFHMSTQQVRELLSAEGWSINDDTGMVTPSAAASQLKKDNIVAGVNQSLLLLKRATEVAAHLEQSPIKIDHK